MALIVTAMLPPDIFAWAEGLRRAHFPPERNLVPAHLTLFHALPPSAEDEARRLLARTAREWTPVAASISRLLDLGKGTALAVDSAGMVALRADLAHHLHGLLSAQDDHPPRLHITIQNKVAKDAARALQAELGKTLRRRDFLFAGLALHRYLGGPWAPLGLWSFSGKKRG